MITAPTVLSAVLMALGIRSAASRRISKTPNMRMTSTCGENGRFSREPATVQRSSVGMKSGLTSLRPM